MIKGWEEAVKQLKKGHKATLICPPDYAYGAKGAPPVIPPDATLVFELEVLDVNKGVRLSHILMKHNECSIAIDRCRNKKVTRTKAEAISALQNIRDNIVRQGQDWNLMAKMFSECYTQAEQEGDLGMNGPGKISEVISHSSTMITDMTEEAVLALEIDEVSEIIESDSGMHLIKRTE